MLLLYEFALCAILLAALAFLSRFIFWKDIKEIYQLNKEASSGNPEPEKLAKVFTILIFKLLGFGVFLAILVIAYGWNGQ